MSKTVNPILIASSSFDDDTHRPVCEHLVRRGHPIVLYRTDKVLNGSDRLEITITDAGDLIMAYNGQSIAPSVLGAAWYWKVSGLRVANAEHNVAKQLSMVNEITQWNSAIWGLYPDDLWLNSPQSIAAADRKLGQLLLAQQVGFAIPKTLVASDWDFIVDGLSGAGRTMIVKMLRGVIADHNELRVMYTTPLTNGETEALRESTVPFPGLYQPFIGKAREWRITVVGDIVFSVAIYTTEAAKDDWRRLQATSAVRFEHTSPPGQTEARCWEYLSRQGLKYGAFDLIEQPDGQIVFLECNPNGQHNWLEEELGLPISDAIASELITIAMRRA